MPRYLITEGGVAKIRTDEERREKGFNSRTGNCIDATLDTFKDLTEKFGNHFEMVYVLMDKRTASIVRLMNEEERKSWLGSSRYQGHWVVYNKKNKLYIDKSNNQSIISSDKEWLSNFNEDTNKFVRVYQFGIDFICNYQTDKKTHIGDFMCNMLRYYEPRLPTHKEEVAWKKKGMRILKEYKI